MKKYRIYEKRPNGILSPCLECAPFPETDQSRLKIALHFIKTENEIICREERYFLVEVPHNN